MSKQSQHQDQAHASCPAAWLHRHLLLLEPPRWAASPTSKDATAYVRLIAYYVLITLCASD